MDVGPELERFECFIYVATVLGGSNGTAIGELAKMEHHARLASRVGCSQGTPAAARVKRVASLKLMFNRSHYHHTNLGSRFSVNAAKPSVAAPVLQAVAIIAAPLIKCDRSDSPIISLSNRLLS